MKWRDNYTCFAYLTFLYLIERFLKCHLVTKLVSAKCTLVKAYKAYKEWGCRTTCHDLIRFCLLGRYFSLTSTTGIALSVFSSMNWTSSFQFLTVCGCVLKPVALFLAFLHRLVWTKITATESRFGTFDSLSYSKAYVTLHSGTITLVKIKEVVIILSQLISACSKWIAVYPGIRGKRSLWLLFSASYAAVSGLDRMINKLRA